MTELNEITQTKERLEAPISEVVQLSNEFARATSPSEVTDDQFFPRTIYSLDSGAVKVFFRGREELPVLDLSGPSAIVSPKERPLRTSADDFGDWMIAVTHGDPYSNPFERAAKTGQPEVALIANATPLGLTELAIQISEIGIGDPKKLSSLKSLHESLEDKVVTDEVLQLYDDIFAATVIDSQGKIVSPGASNGIHEDGLLQVALSLAGDASASELVAKKRRLLNTYDELRIQKEFEYTRDDQAHPPVGTPGEQLTDDQLEYVKEKHFVAVQTTPVMPYHIAENGEGLSVLRPTSVFGEDNTSKFPRNTLHFSLNHPVESHIGGNFNERPVTIVSPLEDMLKLNGKPAVLYGVDTYFTTNPGQGVFLPESSTIIQIGEATEGAYIELIGNVIKISDDQITADNIQEYNKLIADIRGDDHLTFGSLIASTNVFSSFIWDNTITEKRFESDYDDIPERAQFLEDAKAFRELMDEHITRDPAGYAEYELAVVGVLNDFANNPGLVDTQPEVIQQFIREGMRRCLVKTLIAFRFHGKNVESDGMSAYIEDAAFSKDVKDTAQLLGVRSGLHTYQPESEIERNASEAVAKATEPLPRNVEATPGAAGDFSWEKYDSDALWRLLINAPGQSRRMLVGMDYLTFSHQEKPRSLDEDLLV